MPEYRVGRLGRRFVVSVYDAAGTRTNRYRLNARTAGEAEREAPGVVAALSRPTGKTVHEIWNAFVADREGRAIIATMVHTWKAIEPIFGGMAGDAITVANCRAHTAARRKASIKSGTIATELGHLRMVLRWAEKRGMIERAPYIERPTPPRRKEIHLTREQCRLLIDAAPMPHIRLYILLALATGGRNEALLQLTWRRCDFERAQIDLRNPEITRPHKGRAIVPMNRTIRAALAEARDSALSDHVIEWGGKPIASIKKGIKAAARAAGMEFSVSPHLLRHSAAVHMAEAGISMDEIAQYLGHEDVNVTRKKYARFSPTYLRRAAAALEFDDLARFNEPESTTFSTEIPSQVFEKMVGATGIEPQTTL
jgi:integrase